MLPIAYVTVEELFVLRRSDVLQAVMPLVRVVLASIPDGSSVSRELAVPPDAWWKRMNRNYGEPTLLIAAVGTPIQEGDHSRRVFRPDEIDVDVAVLRSGSVFPLARTPAAPYGYSSDESSAAWIFTASRGEALTVTLARQPFRNAQMPSGEVVIVPNWPPGEIASALDGFAFLDG